MLTAQNAYMLADFLTVNRVVLAGSSHTAKSRSDGTTDRFTRWSAYHTVLFITIVILTLGALGESNEILLSVSIALAPAMGVATLVAAILTVVQTNVRRHDRTTIVWFCFMLTVFVWFLSSAAFSIYPLLGAATPPVSLGDGFELAGYAPMLVGLVVQAWPFREGFAGKMVKLALVVVAIVSVLVFYSVFVGLITAGLPPLFLAVKVSYLILDFLALAIAIPSLVMFMRGTFWKPFLFLVMGLVISLGADVIATWTILIGTYYNLHPVDILYSLAYLSAVLGFHLRRKQSLSKLL